MKHFRKLRRTLKKLRLRPIEVFLFHQVSDAFDPATMKSGDWSQTDQFKANVGKLSARYSWVTLDKAYGMMSKDRIRLRRYAALTSDDGWASLKNILPWLNERKIPVTLFVNPGYFDGRHYREKSTERYLSAEEIRSLDSALVSVGLHGWEHVSAVSQTEEEFRESVSKTVAALSEYESYVPYFAYTYGAFDGSRNAVLEEAGLVPVLIDGESNVDDISCIHRVLLDGKIL